MTIRYLDAVGESMTSTNLRHRGPERHHQTTAPAAEVDLRTTIDINPPPSIHQGPVGNGAGA
jgi:hypothetical protein